MNSSKPFNFAGTVREQINIKQRSKMNNNEICHNPYHTETIASTTKYNPFDHPQTCTLCMGPGCTRTVWYCCIACWEADKQRHSLTCGKNQEENVAQLVHLLADMKNDMARVQEDIADQLSDLGDALSAIRRELGEVNAKVVRRRRNNH
jgi:hypothetical protein